MLLWSLWLFACGSDEPHWAVAQMTAVPGTSGVTGTQVWSFFSARWGAAEGDGAYLCSVGQTFIGTVTAPDAGCEGCLVAYDLAFSPLDGDCPDELGQTPAFDFPGKMGVGDAPSAYADLDPQDGRSLGWYADLGGGGMEVYGFAWDDALDWGGQAGPPGWNVGQVYTLSPVIAWEL